MNSRRRFAGVWRIGEEVNSRPRPPVPAGIVKSQHRPELTGVIFTNHQGRVRRLRPDADFAVFVDNEPVGTRVLVSDSQLMNIEISATCTRAQRPPSPPIAISAGNTYHPNAVRLVVAYLQGEAGVFSPDADPTVGQ